METHPFLDSPRRSFAARLIWKSIVVEYLTRIFTRGLLGPPIWAILFLLFSFSRVETETSFGDWCCAFFPFFASLILSRRNFAFEEKIVCMYVRSATAMILLKKFEIKFRR
jgi:hypothetical protein